MVSIIYRVWLQLDSKRRRQFFYVLMLSIIVSLLEVVSVGAILPFIAALTAPEKLFTLSEVRIFVEYFEINSAEGLLMPMTILFVLLTIISSVFRMLLVWAQTRFSFSVGIELSNKMYMNALNRTYLEHIKSNSNKAIADIILKAEMFVDGLILPVMVIIGAIFLLIFMTTFVVMLDPYIALFSVIGFGSLYLLITVSIRKKLEDYGVNILRGQDNVFVILREGFGSFRDIVLDNLQAVYSEKFLKTYALLRNSKASVAIIGSIPRYAIEAIGMTIIAIAAFKMTTSGVDQSYILPILGGFALSAQKLLPILQQSYSSWASLKGSCQSISNALALLEIENPHHPSEQGESPKSNYNKHFFNQGIMLKNIVFSYDNDNKKAINNINIEINKGESVAFMGQTGSGKSTLLDLIMGLLEPTLGDILVDGRKITEINKKEWQSHISHVPQIIFLLDTTIIANIALGVPVKDIDFDRVLKAAKDAKISDFINSLPDGYDTVVGEDGCDLSGGQRQRIGIARALYKKSDLIVLDEATSALDSKTEAEVLSAILKNKERTVLMITHRSEILHNCDNVIYVENGSISLPPNETRLKSLKLIPL